MEMKHPSELLHSNSKLSNSFGSFLYEKKNLIIGKKKKKNQSY